MPSNLTYYGGDIPEKSAATPGLWNRRFSTISGNLDVVNTGSLATQRIGGTGLTSTTTGDLLLGRSNAPALGTLGDVVAGQILTSGGVAADPSYSPTYVQTLSGTANQITSSASTGGVTLSLPSALTVPGGLQVTNPAFFADGTAAAPSVAFTSERSLGFYRSASSTVVASYGTLAASQISSLATSYTSSLVLAAPLNLTNTGPVLTWSDITAMGLFRDTNAATVKFSGGTFYVTGGGAGVRASAVTIDGYTESIGTLFADKCVVSQYWYLTSRVEGGLPSIQADGGINGDVIILGGQFGAYFAWRANAGGGFAASGNTFAVGYTTPPNSENFAVKGNSSFSDYVWAQGARGFFMGFGTALQPTVAYASEQSLGLYRSAASTTAQSYGSFTVPTLVESATFTPTGTASGVTGKLAWDGSFVCVCASANSWRRAALSAF